MGTEEGEGGVGEKVRKRKIFFDFHLTGKAQEVRGYKEERKESKGVDVEVVVAMGI